MSIISNNKPIIGIDFDNTIVTYDSVFTSIANDWYSLNLSKQSNKVIVRDTLRKENDGEKKWQRLQTEVYGRSIERAAPAKGVVQTLAKLKDNGFDLKIISHKTEFANTDKSINLRDAARDWLQTNNIMNSIIAEDNIYFASTREAKIAKIIENGCDIFIDDLIEVFTNTAFPDKVERILFSEQAPPILTNIDHFCSCWYGIAELLLNECQ